MIKRYILGSLAAAAGCVMLLGTIHTETLQQGISEKILRFHVLANSDSGEDQALKLKVRDAVGTYLAKPLAEAESLEESEAIVEENIPEIEQVAGNVVQEEGYDYTVDASLEKLYVSGKDLRGIYVSRRRISGAAAGDRRRRRA